MKNRKLLTKLKTITMVMLAGVIVPLFGNDFGHSFPGLQSVASTSNCNTIIGENGIEANWTSKVVLSAKDFQGNPVAVNFAPNAGNWVPNSGGVGMISPAAPEVGGNPRLELGFRGGFSEELTVDFGAATVGLRSAVVTVSRFYIESGRTERGSWRALNASMVEVGSGEFLATEPIGGNNPGLGTVIINTAVSFRYLVFTAKANISGGDPSSAGSDNSDYLVRQIVTECVDIFETCEGKIIGKDGEEANWLASGVAFDLKDFQGNTVANPTFVTNAAAGWRANSGGVGIVSPAAPEVTGGPRPEIAFRNGLTETMTVDLGAEITGLKKMKVSVARFYIEGNRVERGQWVALDFDGNPTGQSGIFTATEPISDLGTGILTFDINPTATFRYLVFTALANTVGVNEITTGADNSDYLLREIVIECDDEGDPDPTPDVVCIDPFDDAFPAETHVKHLGGVITEIFEPKGLEIGIVPVPRSPNNDEVGETMFNLNRSVENRLQTGLATVLGGSRRGHLKFMGPGPSPQPIRRADAVIEGSKLSLVSNDRCASELKLYYPEIFVDGLTPIANLSDKNEFLFQSFTNPGGTNIDVTIRVTSHTAGVEKNRTVAFSMNADGDYVVPFSSFLPWIDFANVTRIVVTINSPIESDWSINGFCARRPLSFVRTTAIRPEITEVENEILTMPSVEATLYPMPATDRMTAFVDVDDEVAIPYTISDLTGRVINRGVWYTSDDRKLDIPVKDLNNGMYLFTYSVNGATKANKFIIRK